MIHDQKMIPMGTISSGCYFNAYSCLTNRPCCASIVGLMFTHLYMLTYDDIK